jgi:hypothetical protein
MHFKKWRHIATGVHCGYAGNVGNVGKAWRYSKRIGDKWNGIRPV